MVHGKELLKEIRDIRKASFNQSKKKKNESDRDYIIRKAGNRCEYCRIKFPKDKLSVVRKDPDKNLPKIKNGLCVCRECANEKGSMSDREFRKYLAKKKKEMRKEVVENYQEIREEVFGKYNYDCIYCKIEFGESNMPQNRKLTIDHKVPISRGGTNDRKNLCCSCEEHNFDKKDRTAEEYIELLKKKIGNN